MSPENANLIEDAPSSSDPPHHVHPACSTGGHPLAQPPPPSFSGLSPIRGVVNPSFTPTSSLTVNNNRIGCPGPSSSNIVCSSSNINKAVAFNSNNLQFNVVNNNQSINNNNSSNVANNQNTTGPLDNNALPTRLDNGLPPRYDEDVNIKLVKVVVLGAQGVGKTSIVRRFVRNEYSLSYERSTAKSEYFPSLILNERLFELKIIDLPVIPYFPASTAIEWTPEFRYLGLRSAGAYVLVYDSPATFQFLKSLKEQICASRDMSNIPVIVVANKVDLLPPPGSNLLQARERKEIVHLVKKTWRMSHIECSAKYNWNVCNVFRELAVTLDMIANGEVIRSQHSVRKRRCLMF